MSQKSLLHNRGLFKAELRRSTDRHAVVSSIEAAVGQPHGRRPLAVCTWDGTLPADFDSFWDESMSQVSTLKKPHLGQGLQ